MCALRHVSASGAQHIVTWIKQTWIKHQCTFLEYCQNTVVCPGCKAPCLLPGQPLLAGSAWTCTACSLATPEETVRATVSHLMAELKSLTLTERYNVAKWLELDRRAAARVHPQHQIRVEVAKWLVSILCRGPSATSEDFPRHELEHKLEMAQRQLNVLEVVDPGKSSCVLTGFILPTDKN